MVDDIAIQFDLLNARMREGNINRLDQKTSKLFEVSVKKAKDQRTGVKWPGWAVKLI